MSNHELLRTILLSVYSEDQAAELFIDDHQFRLVESGRGRLETKLTPGIYQITLRVGSSVEARIIRVREGDRPASVKFDRTEFLTPVPLAQTAGAPVYHGEAARRMSRTPPVNVGRGGGSSILVFVRDCSGPEECRQTSPSTVHPARGLSLRNAEGAEVLDLSERSESNLDDTRGAANIHPWAACHVEVAPGPYLLRLETANGCLERTIIASEGWQTQVFLTQRDYIPGRDDLLADLPGASILLARPGLGFDPSEMQSRLVELTRLGLANRRQVLPDDLIGQVLNGSFENPMLGLFGTHLLLQQKKVRPKEMRTIVSRLRTLLGKDSHPDVEALALRIDRRRVSFRFSVPPMLQRSWRFIVHATIDRQELTPVDSLAIRAAFYFWDERVWLPWMWPAKSSSLVEGNREAGFREHIRQILRTPPEVMPSESPSGATHLSVPKRRSKGASRKTTSGAAKVVAEKSREQDRPPVDDAMMERFIRTSGLPRSLLEELLKPRE